MAKRQLLFACLSLVWMGCGVEGEGEGEYELSSHSQALNACDEMVPETRKIDGFPAYAQCAAYQAGPIYSNNGIDTASTKVGPDWVQTQGSGGYQCTELAHRYWLFKYKMAWLPRGNAGSWCDSQPPSSSGVVQSMTPVHGDLMVLAPGSCGANASTGHVTVVDLIDQAQGRLTVVEQNGARRGTYQASCAKCFLHIVNQDSAATGDAGSGAASDAGVAVADAGADAGSASDAGLARPITNVPDASAPWMQPSTTSIADAAPAVSPVITPSSTGAVVPMATTVGTALAGSPAPEAQDDSAGCSVSHVAGGRSDRLLLFVLGLLTILCRRRSRSAILR